MDRAAARNVEDALRGLPELEVPQPVWRNVLAGVEAHRSRTRHRRRYAARLVPFAAAASLLVGLGAWYLVAAQPSTEPEPDIAALFERSRTVEARRRALPAVLAPSGVERVLQVRIGGIDDLLNEQLLEGHDPVAREALLRERVELMEGLSEIERYRHETLFRQAMY